MAEQEIVLSDGSTLVLPDDMPDEQVMVSIRNAEDQLTGQADMSADPSDTDSWGTYGDKLVKSAVRGGVGGLASTVDFLGNTVAVAPRMAVNKLRGKPLLEGFGGAGIRDAYENNVIPQPRGSDYETTADVSEIAVPALAETLLTGSPKSALWRAPRDVALGMGGGYAGEEIGRRVGGEEYADLGRTLGSVVAPGSASRTGARSAAAIGTGGLSTLTRLLRKYGLDPFDIIPASTKTDAMNRALIGGSASQAHDWEER